MDRPETGPDHLGGRNQLRHLFLEGYRRPERTVDLGAFGHHRGGNHEHPLDRHPGAHPGDRNPPGHRHETAPGGSDVRPGGLLPGRHGNGGRCRRGKPSSAGDERPSRACPRGGAIFYHVHDPAFCPRTGPNPGWGPIHHHLLYLDFVHTVVEGRAYEADYGHIPFRLRRKHESQSAVGSQPQRLSFCAWPRHWLCFPLPSWRKHRPRPRWSPCYGALTNGSKAPAITKPWSTWKSTRRTSRTWPRMPWSTAATWTRN